MMNQELRLNEDIYRLAAMTQNGTTERVCVEICCGEFQIIFFSLNEFFKQHKSLRAAAVVLGDGKLPLLFSLNVLELSKLEAQDVHHL